MTLRSLRKFHTLKPFDASTEAGRSDERYRRAAITSTANLLSRGLAMGVMILTVGLTLPYLGAERFGVWMTIAGFTGILSFLDLGVGNALTNKVAHAATLEDRHALSGLISGGLGFLFVVGVCVVLILILLTYLLPWEILIKVKDESLYIELQQVLLLFCILFGMQVVSNGFHRVFAGLQRAFESHLISAIGSGVSLICILMVANAKGGLLLLLASTFGIQVIVGFFLIFMLRRMGYLDMKNLLEKIKKTTPELLQTGSLFLILQIGVMISSGIDILLISSVLGAEQVAIFAVVQRLFQFSTQPLGILNAPLWSAYADADARREKKFIKKTLILSLKNTGIFATTAAVFLIIFGDIIISAWTNKAIQAPILLLIAYGVWAIFEAVGNALGVFLNGCGIIRPQVVNVIIFSVISIFVKFYALKYYGVEAMIFGLIFSYTLVTAIMYGYYFRGDLMSKIL